MHICDVLLSLVGKTINNYVSYTLPSHVFAFIFFNFHACRSRWIRVTNHFSCLGGGLFVSSGMYLPFISLPSSLPLLYTCSNSWQFSSWVKIPSLSKKTRYNFVVNPVMWSNDPNPFNKQTKPKTDMSILIIIKWLNWCSIILEWEANKWTVRIIGSYLSV